jgi:hypothetical protein
MRDDLDLAVELAQPLARRIELLPSDRARAVEDLPVEVRRIDAVKVDEADPPHARRGEVRRHRTAEPTGADDQHRGPLQSQLPRLTDLRQQQVARVARAFGVGEGHGVPRVS